MEAEGQFNPQVHLDILPTVTLLSNLLLFSIISKIIITLKLTSNNSTVLIQ